MAEAYYALPYASEYRFDGVDLPISDLSPKVIHKGVPAADEKRGGILAADLDGDGKVELILTAPGLISARSADGRELWRSALDIHLTDKAESQGLPGLHAPGVALVGHKADTAARLLFLDTDGRLNILHAMTGALLHTIDLPPPPPEANHWQHLVTANLQSPESNDLLLQATDQGRHRRGRFVAAFALDQLVDQQKATWPLWTTDEFQALAHSGLRVADLNGDGRHEILGGSLLSPDGNVLLKLELPRKAHFDALAVADIRPDLPGLEVVVLEEKGQNRIFLYGHQGLLWETHFKHQEPQNMALGDFDPSRPGLEIWCRSRYKRHQKPWVLDALGNRIAHYQMRDRAPKGWTVKGIEEISTLHWSSSAPPRAVAKERHRSGDVAVFEPVTGQFQIRLKEHANRLYVADVLGDWREEIIVWSATRINVYSNPAPNTQPDRPRLWADDHYRRSKTTWNYYNP
ncbi:MAG: hypothetical protein K0U74_14295 [Alphaproteobacteria bacterium]|nr:hypothetical protein [Alphaproteobacteria bacterium]